MKLDSNGERLAFNRMDPASVDSNDYMFINPLVMDKNADILYMAAGNKLWRNNDISNVPYNNSHAKNDFGWEMFTDTITNPNMIITTIETSVNPPNVVYLGTKYKKIFRIDNAHAGDPSIVELPYPLTGSNSYVYDIAVNPDNADEVMIVYSNYSVYSLFHSMDGGQSWNKIAGNLEQNASGSGNGPSCRTAKIIPLGSSTLYLVGTSVGLFGTASLDDNNTVWEQVGSTEIGAVVVEFLEYRENDGLLVVATHGNGIYQTNLTSVGDVLATDNLKDNFDLTVFPNPVDDILSLAVNTDIIADSKAVIYDELGRKVGQEHNQKLYSGANTIQLNIKDYKAGIYFVSLTIDNKSITKQIIKK